MTCRRALKLEAARDNRTGAVGLVRGAWALLRLGADLDRGRLLRAIALMSVGYLAAPLSALALAAFTNDALGGHGSGTAAAPRATAALVTALVVAVLLVAQLMCSHFAHLDYFELAELQQAHLERELMGVVNGPPTIAHLDDAGFSDNLQLVREGLMANTRSLEAVLQIMGLLLQMTLTAVLLVRLDPWLVLLPLMALPPVWAGNRAQAVLEDARQTAAEALRLNRHLVEVATSAGSVKEVRLFAAQEELLRRQQLSWDSATSTLWRGQARSAAWRAAGQVFFALAYGAAVLAVVRQQGLGTGDVGSLVLVITLAAQVSTQVSGALSLLATLQSAAHMTRRLQLMRVASTGPRLLAPNVGSGAGPEALSRRPRLARPPAGAGRAAPPLRLEGSLVLDEVSFSYPGSDRFVLDRVSLELPASSSVALVGENGAGKSTFVKLLCGLYTPTGGHILVDGTDLAEIDPVLWRARLATLFQDYSRVELTLRESTGLGDLDRMGEGQVVRRALIDARAERVLERLPGGLDGYVGRAYEDGMDLSGGQWQTVALSRTLMRQAPLLLVLDEPAAALDASAEHAIFERYAASAQGAGAGHGGVTVLVSHRFSTVLMADSIAVLEHGRLIEHGPHRQLVAAGGLYAELFRLQQRAYQAG